VALFSKSRVAKYFTSMTRIELANFALSFLDQVAFLHAHNILIGDINPLNILIQRDDPTKSWLIDTDSFQIDELPCPVGTDLFTPPHLQGKNFAHTLRSVGDESFSVAIMLFMILMMGKHPYAVVGGASPADNIKRRLFPYPKKSGKQAKIPVGVWGYIWSNFNKELKEDFYDLFTGRRTMSVAQWQERIRQYRWMLLKGYLAKELFVQNYRVFNPVDVECEICHRNFAIERWWSEELAYTSLYYKLKEMEYMEKIADKIGKITVSAKGNVVEQLKTIFSK